MSETRQMILNRLADGDVYSGTLLAEQLDITRAAVWKHIKALRAEGVIIEADAGNGYYIPGGLQLLDTTSIERFLGADAVRGQLVLLGKTASTNDWLMQRYSELTPGTVCLAEQQTSGRGTRGRRWVSPFGNNLYLSLYWHFPGGPFELGGLSLAIAAAIAEGLEQAGAHNISIKWPNDLYTGKGKLGGILIDMSAEVNGPSHVVIGVGLNIGMPEDHYSQIDQAAADLRDAGLPATVDRNQVAASVISALWGCCRKFQTEGFSAYRKLWQQRDMIIGHEVQLVNGDRVITGKANGVDNMGALELMTQNGLQLFASGDVSLRLA